MGGQTHVFNVTTYSCVQSPLDGFISPTPFSCTLPLYLLFATFCGEHLHTDGTGRDGTGRDGTGWDATGWDKDKEQG